MDHKPCSRCSRPADYSLLVLLSTVGTRPRNQKSSQSILLCKACLQDSTTVRAPEPLLDIQEQLSDVLTRVGGHPADRINGQVQPSKSEEDHQESGEAVSCRPCLKACNSRHGGEVGGQE